MNNGTLKALQLVDQLRDELNRIQQVHNNQASVEALDDCRDNLSRIVICLADVGPDRDDE